MPFASVMADEPQPIAEPGAPIPKDQPDPELIKLRGPRPKVGLITSAGLVFLSILFFLRLNPDRKFSGEADKPDRVSVADVLGGQVATDRYVTIDAELLVSHAVRATASKGSVGLRVVPARGTGERLWIVLSGDGWEEPRLTGYAGRLRRLADLPFAQAVRDFTRDHPRPVFAGGAAVRAGLANGKVTAVTGDALTIGDADRVAFDVVDPDAATIICTLNDSYPTVAAWTAALAKAGIQGTVGKAAIPEQVRFDVTQPNALADVKQKLDAAGLFAARVDPVTHHYDTTWGALRASPATGFTVDAKTTVPDAQVDLVGLYVSRGVPDDAYALITDEKPADYWYVLWITIALGAVCLVFLWALVRAVKRDLLPTRA
jgi:hypothetical protein